MSAKGSTSAQVAKPDRRGILRLIGVAGVAGFGLIRGLADAAPPKETGLSFEGLLKHEPGFQPRKIARLAYDEIPGFLSKAQLARNYAIYRAAFAEFSLRPPLRGPGGARASLVPREA